MADLRIFALDERQKAAKISIEYDLMIVLRGLYAYSRCRR
jgi:hypothetical protein